MFTIYKLTSPDGKVYIGCTSHVNLKHRFGRDGEGYRGQPYIWPAIQKFGWNNFKHEVIATTESREEASTLERHYIQEYDSMNLENGYNVRPGGIGSPLPPVPPEVGRKISRSKKGCVWVRKGDQIKQVRPEEVATFEAAGWRRGCRNLTETEKQHLREINTGKHPSPESIAKVVAVHKGKKIMHKGDIECRVAPADIEQYLAQGYELGRSPRAVQHIGETSCGRVQSAETRMKRSQSMQGKLVGRKHIHKGEAHKMVRPEDVAAYLADGWELGPKPKGGN